MCNSQPKDVKKADDYCTKKYDEKNIIIYILLILQCV